MYFQSQHQINTIKGPFPHLCWAQTPRPYALTNSRPIKCGAGTIEICIFMHITSWPVRTHGIQGGPKVFVGETLCATLACDERWSCILLGSTFHVALNHSVRFASCCVKSSLLPARWSLCPLQSRCKEHTGPTVEWEMDWKKRPNWVASQIAGPHTVRSLVLGLLTLENVYKWTDIFQVQE